jgi:hypothetical protein
VSRKNSRKGGKQAQQQHGDEEEQGDEEEEVTEDEEEIGRETGAAGNDTGAVTIVELEELTENYLCPRYRGIYTLGIL